MKWPSQCYGLMANLKIVLYLQVARNAYIYADMPHLQHESSVSVQIHVSIASHALFLAKCVSRDVIYFIPLPSTKKVHML